MGWASKRADGIIAISRRLEQHYLQAGLPVLRVPPMFEPAELVRKWSQDDGSLHLCYAGSPGRKEAFDVIVDGCNAAAAAGVSLVLHLIGITQNQWHSLAGPAAFDCDVRCYGRVPNEHAREIVGACDFSLVVRPFRRSNQYGFPSKCAESLSLGTPVIANLFSDLGEELTEGKDSLILKELSAEALTDRIVTASGMTPDCRKAMAGAARALGARRFSPQSHAERITRFLERLA